MQVNVKYINHILRIILVFLCLMLAFVRSFMGIYIFNFRLGELLVGLTLLLTFMILLLLISKYDIFFEIDKKIKIFYFLVVASFFLIISLSNGDLSSTYTYKTSSYIWTMSFMFLGYFFYSYGDADTEKLLLWILNPVLYMAYFFQVFDIPDSVVNFFLSISDKFEPHKGSDLTILFVITFLLNDKYFRKSQFYVEYYILFFSLYAPFLYFKSRASFIAVLLFVLMQFLNSRKYYLEDVSVIRLFFVVVISSMLFLQSVFWVRQSGIITFYEARENVISLVEYRTQTYTDNPDEGLFWISDGRLRTADGNLGWRLDIWQDIIFDLKETNKIFFGYGYNGIIPVMEWENGYRLGLDGLNENVHNNWFNILARGGIFQVTLFVFLLLFIVRNSLKNSLNYNIFIFIIPILFVSFFDSSMENAHFPILYYFFLGRELKVTN